MTTTVYTCPLDECSPHPAHADGPCLVVVVDGRGQTERPCLCAPCDRCLGYGVVVVGQDHDGDDIEWQCSRCTGWGRQ